MKKKTETVKHILYAALCSLFMIIYPVVTQAQIPALFPDGFAGTVQNPPVSHTNNDIIGLESAVVWDENFSYAFISFADRTTDPPIVSSIALNSGQSAYDPDVSILIDNADVYAIAVYEDPSVHTVNADIFMNGTFVVTKIIWHPGRRPKIDGGQIVWEDLSTPPERNIMECNVQIIAAAVSFSTPTMLLKGSGTGNDYSDPDVTVDAGMHYTCIGNGTDLIYDGGILGSGYSNPRISSGTIFPDDIEVVAESGGRIYGFSMATITGTGTPPPNPIYYGDGSSPVCAYVYDVFAVLFEHSGGGVVAYLCSRDGFTISGPNVIPQPPPTGDLCYVSLNAQSSSMAPSVTGSISFELYSSFWDGGGQVSDKLSVDVMAPGGSGIFRTATTMQMSATVYPNPFTNNININLSFNDENPANFKVSIMDALGRTVYQAITENEKQIIWNAGNNIGSGIYFLRVENAAGELIMSSKISKQ